MENAITVKKLSKKFREQANSKSLKEFLLNLSIKNRPKNKNAQIFKDISFTIKKGEFFGIVGRNGSGKSTLLKILAGVYVPTSGVVEINGRLNPFIELGVGFNPELSGRDNVFLNASLLGFSRDKITKIYDDIVEFAELDGYMDLKLKHYSSGMQVRLAFSVAIRAESDILLIDEVLAVGDAAFQQKCFKYFDGLKKEKKTVILVTHDMAIVERFCDRVLFIDKTKEVKVYGVSEAVSHYNDVNSGDKRGENPFRKTPARIERVQLFNSDLDNTLIIKAEEKITIRLYIDNKSNEKSLSITTSLFGNDWVKLIDFDIYEAPMSIGLNEMEIVLDSLPLNSGKYSLIFGLYGKETQYDLYDDLTVQIKNLNDNKGILIPKYRWAVKAIK